LLFMKYPSLFPIRVCRDGLRHDNVATFQLSFQSTHEVCLNRQ
jgi:hypothetical protein